LACNLIEGQPLEKLQDLDILAPCVKGVDAHSGVYLLDPLKREPKISKPNSSTYFWTYSGREQKNASKGKKQFHIAGGRE